MEIRRVQTIEEYKTVENIQKEIWGMVGEHPVPVPMLIVINTNGGLVEIAEEDHRIVGFSLAFPGADGDYRYLCSHMAGVLREYRDMHIGYDIKMHQFDVARKLGYSEVRWVFDPMRARNAFFNVHKLGAYAYDYHTNYYGILESTENEGVESDRIEAHKFLDRDPIGNENFEVVGKITDFPSPWKEIRSGGDSVAIEVPMELGGPDLTLANEWRMALRRVIPSLERKRYVINEVVKHEKSVYLIFTLRDRINL